MQSNFVSKSSAGDRTTLGSPYSETLHRPLFSEKSSLESQVEWQEHSPQQPFLNQAF